MDAVTALEGECVSEFIRAAAAKRADETLAEGGRARFATVEHSGRLELTWTNSAVVAADVKAVVGAAVGHGQLQSLGLYVARRGNVAVAVGDRFEGSVRPAAWSSTSPGDWSAVTSPTDALRSFDGRIDALAAGPDGFVAVGSAEHNSGTEIRVFRSDDGRLACVLGLLQPPGERFGPLGVAATGTRVVIVGDTEAGAGTDGRIWVGSSDGSWRGVERSRSA